MEIIRQIINLISLLVNNIIVILMILFIDNRDNFPFKTINIQNHLRLFNHFKVVEFHRPSFITNLIQMETLLVIFNHSNLQ